MLSATAAYLSSTPKSTNPKASAAVLVAQAKLEILRQAQGTVSDFKAQRLRRIAEGLDVFVRILYRLQDERR